MKKMTIKTVLLACIFSGMVFSNDVLANDNSIYNQVYAQVSNNSDGASFINQAEAFRSNAESFKKMLDGMDDKDVEKNKEEIINIVDSMLDNNAKLQNMIKAKISKSSNSDSQQFYMRQILPNLQNLNRQITRIKLSAKGKVNIKNMKDQAERTYESISQVVDRIKTNESK